MKTKTKTETKTVTTTAAPAPVLRRIYTTPNRPVIDLGKRQANRALATGPLLDMMHAEAPDLHKHALIVGSWVWVEFTTKPQPATTAKLAEFGFHWNNKRQLWQHPCGSADTAAGPGDPRQRYGASPATDYIPA